MKLDVMQIQFISFYYRFLHQRTFELSLGVENRHNVAVF